MADPEGKLVHLDLAKRWLRLAAQIEEMDAETRSDSSLVPLPAGDHKPKLDENQRASHRSTPRP